MGIPQSGDLGLFSPVGWEGTRHSLQARNSRRGLPAKRYHLGKIGCKSITLYKSEKTKENKKQSPEPGSAVRDGDRGVPGIPSPASPTAPGTGHGAVPGLRGAGEAGERVRLLANPRPESYQLPAAPPGQLRPLLSASGGVLSLAFA